MAKHHILSYQYFFINLIVAFILVRPRIDSLSKYISMPLTKQMSLIVCPFTDSPINSFFPFILTTLVLLILYYMSRTQKVYLVDFTCYRPSDKLRFPFEKFMHYTHNIPTFEPSSIAFQEKILQRSGLGNNTALPPSHHVMPYTPTMLGSRGESELVIFSILDSLFKKTEVKPKNIDILVVNCSLFTPTPSLSSMIINKYKMKSSIKSYSLGGMGCSAGLISLALARDVLHAHKNSTALVVTTEIITEHWYTGNTRPMLLANCLFRMGGAGILLSNKRRDSKRAKYELLHVVRTTNASYDDSYNCVYQQQDENLKTGVSLSKSLTSIAGRALKENISTIAPLVLPFSELFKFTIGYMRKKPYFPDFKKAFEHFCIHAGGRAVIDELSTRLKLSEEQVEPSKMTLYRFGNTSSSSPWYELSYVESKGRMRKGDRVWQIGLGSGFKCNSAVWKCRREVEMTVDSPWADCMDMYPVQVPDVINGH